MAAAEVGKSREDFVPIHPTQITGPRGGSLATGEKERGIPLLDGGHSGPTDTPSRAHLAHLAERAGVYASPAGQRLHEAAQQEDPEVADQAITELLLGREPEPGVLLVAENERVPIWEAGKLRIEGFGIIVPHDRDYRINAVYASQDGEVDVVRSSRFAVGSHIRPGDISELNWDMTRNLEVATRYEIDSLVTDVGEFRPETAASFHSRFLATVLSEEDEPVWGAVSGRLRMNPQAYLDIAGQDEALQEYFHVGFSPEGQPRTLTLWGVGDVNTPATVLLDSTSPHQVKKTGDIWTMPMGNVMHNENILRALAYQRERQQT